MIKCFSIGVFHSKGVFSVEKFFKENKLEIFAVTFDILVIIAVIVFFICDVSAWIAFIFGVIAVTLNILAKRKRKGKSQKH